MRITSIHKVFGIVWVVLIYACTPTQRPLKNGQGYVLVPVIENQFRIEYYLKYADQVESQWNTTAGQLCPGGYKVIYSKRHTLNFDMYVPIAGNNVNIGRQEFIQYGQVVCNGAASNSVILTESKWKEFNAETSSVTPVSERWMTETLKLYANHLADLPAYNSIAALQKIWGKPFKQDHQGAGRLTLWMKGGDSWYPNYIGLIERNDCLRLMMVLPGISALTMEINKLPIENNSLEQMLFTGVVPAYFYTLGADCSASSSASNIE